MSNIIESLRDDMAALHKADAIDKATMRGFDAACPLPERECTTSTDADRTARLPHLIANKSR